MSSDELCVLGSDQAKGKCSSLRDAVDRFLKRKAHPDVFEGAYSLPNLRFEIDNLVSNTEERAHLGPYGDLVASFTS